ncbi:MAG: ABC transporter permease subunit [Chloroflexi bacterium]|nr:ABC transporter permease subunit [Chloroflexota bacterium]
MSIKRRRKIEEFIFVWLMRLALTSAALVLGLILVIITSRGLQALSWEMISQPPGAAFYLGGGGGILNAIVGSLYLAAGATLLALGIAIPAVMYLHTYARNSRLRHVVRLVLDVLWGIPSIVYGAFGFALMILMGLRASLLAGIIVLALVVLPILARTFDEVLSLSPKELTEATLAMGTTRLELLWVLLRQSLPGLFTAVLLAFSRAIGDAASVLFTAGYTDSLPDSLLRPVASLPLAVFFQLGTPFPEVQARAHASALVLTAIILFISLLAHLSMTRLGRNVIR